MYFNSTKMYKYLNVQQRVPVYYLITVTTFKMCNSLPTIYFYKFNLNLCSQHLFRSLCKRALQTTTPQSFFPASENTQQDSNIFQINFVLSQSTVAFSQGTAYRAALNTCSQRKNRIKWGWPHSGAMVLAGRYYTLENKHGHGKPQKR